MRERPILFSAPMVRAILDGRKTQTRRIVKPAPVSNPREPLISFNHGVPEYSFGLDDRDARGLRWWRCPYGVPGDVLWVRETWGVGNRPCPHNGWVDGIEYRADCVDDCAPPLHDIIPADVEADSIRAGWRPLIHMPRWASRIALRVTDVRIERLNDISAEDADAEGFGGDYPHRVMPDVFPYREDGWGHLSLPECYARLWEHINGPSSWDANPWIWVVSFERADANSP